MILDEIIQCWSPFQKHPVLRVAAVITAGLGALLWAMFPEAPPSPLDLSGLLILAAVLSLVVRRSLGQVWRLRQAARFFRPSRGSLNPKR
jgi:hypothetical protein